MPPFHPCPQYMDKLDGVAYLIGALGQTDRVRAFLKERARSQKGLPPRPVVGTAVSVRGAGVRALGACAGG